MEAALRVIRVLIEHDCQPGIDISNAAAQGWFTAAGIDDEDYSRGLEEAGAKGWLTLTRPGMFQVTAAGISAAR
jgi:hypothetical protein